MLELGDYNIGNGALETDEHGYCLRSLQVCVGDIEEEAICGFWVHLGFSGGVCDGGGGWVCGLWVRLGVGVCRWWSWGNGGRVMVTRNGRRKPQGSLGIFVLFFFNDLTDY